MMSAWWRWRSDHSQLLPRLVACRSRPAIAASVPASSGGSPVDVAGAHPSGEEPRQLLVVELAEARVVVHVPREPAAVDACAAPSPSRAAARVERAPCRYASVTVPSDAVQPSAATYRPAGAPPPLRGPEPVARALPGSNNGRLRKPEPVNGSEGGPRPESTVSPGPARGRRPSMFDTLAAVGVDRNQAEVIAKAIHDRPRTGRSRHLRSVQGRPRRSAGRH